MSEITGERDIDARSIVTLITFSVINILVIFPIPFVIDLSSLRGRGQKESSTGDFKKFIYRRWRYQIGLEVAPVIGVLVLLASTCIPGKVVRDGIVGSEGVRPYDIMTLFVCFAYISLSLDSTGLLRYLAASVATKASSSGSKLYTAFYAFFAITGLFIGNDPLILSGTPFLVYFTSDVKIQDPTAYLFTHFQVSNLVSALLVSSNPTNLVLTSAFHISFLSYSAWLALPTVAAVIVLYPILRYWQFNDAKWIPPRLESPHVDPKIHLKDRWGGIFGATLFLVTIVLLVGLSAGGLLEGWAGVWTVTVPAALAMFIWDCGRDLVVRNRRKRGTTLTSGKGFVADQAEMKRMSGQRLSAPYDREKAKRTDSDLDPRCDHNSTDPIPATEDGSSTRQDTLVHGGASLSRARKLPSAEQPHSLDNIPEQAAANETIPRPNPNGHLLVLSAETDGRSESLLYTIPLVKTLAATFPTPLGTMSRMPFNLVPFAFSMFILVEGLQHTGWIRVFGNWWAAWAKVDQVAGPVWLMGMLSVLGCNFFGTNIGATILLSRVLQYWQLHYAPVSDRTLYSAVFTLAVGSNFGAYSYVFSASLAGLLWRAILGQKDRTVTQLQFIRYNWLPVMVTTIVGCLIVAGEVCVMYKT